MRRIIRRRSWMLALLLMVTMVMSSMAVYAQDSNDDGFTDVPDNHWAKDDIELMADLGIIEGHGDGTFGPEESVTREQFSKMMVLTLGLELIEPSVPFFEDVAKTDWSYKYVETARYYLTGFRTGNGDYFRPTSSAVREDMAVAVVKGLGLSVDDADLSVLNQYNDQGDISSNLRPYVARAITEGIMVGDNGYFEALSTLTRAEAATLLARLIREEKVVYDDEKVTYDDTSSDDESDDSSKTPELVATMKSDKIYLEWTGVPSSGFKYYKVVAAKYEETPEYPDDGYLQYIGNVNDTDTYVYPYDSNNGGDFNKLEPGHKYYFSISAVYEDEVYASNVLYLEIPGDSPSVSTTDRTPSLTVEVESDHIELEWSATSSDNFKYYKVVFSKYDETPIYPGDGYMTYISNVWETEYYVYANQSYNGGDIGGRVMSGETYYVSITAVYDNGDKYYASNTVTVTIPEPVN